MVFGFRDRRDAQTLKQVARERRGEPQSGTTVGLPSPGPPVKAVLLGKPQADIAKGAFGLVDLYSGSTKGAETATGESVSAFARAIGLTAGKWVYVQWVDQEDDAEESGFEAVPAEC